LTINNTHQEEYKVKTKTLLGSAPTTASSDENFRDLIIKIMDSPTKTERDTYFAELVSELSGLTWSIIRRYCLGASHADMQDVYQEITLRLYQRIDQFKPTKPFVYWFSTLAINYCQEWGRSQRRTRRISYPLAETTTFTSTNGGRFGAVYTLDLYPSRSPDPSQDYDLRAFLEIFSEVLTKFCQNRPEYLTIVIRGIRGERISEICEATGLSQSQVKHTNQKWRAFLQDRLERIGYIRP
jgi:RNA polymerase sigma factor (sigma-70 family)